jgi:Rrf2 family protein
MKLSTRMRYGTRALVELAMHDEDAPISANDIASRQEVSEKYLESLLAALRQAGIVQSVRGAGGGYLLSRPAASITLRDAYEALEGADGLVDCTGNADTCDRSDSCVTRDVWVAIHHHLLDLLDSITLQDLAKKAREKQQHRPDMYFI